MARLAPAVHARCQHGGHNLGANVIQRFGENAHRVARSRGSCVLKGDGEDDALAEKDGFTVSAVPPTQEPLDRKETSRSSWRPEL